MVKSTAVATISKQEMEVKQRMAQAVQEMARPEQSAEEMALAILNATTLEGILGSQVLHMEDMEAVTGFLCVGANLNPSDFTDGLGAYAVLDTIQPDGTRAVVTSGSTNVVAQLVNIHAKKFFPVWVRFKKSDKPTKAGYWVWKLVKGEGEQPSAQQLAAWGEDF